MISSSIEESLFPQVHNAITKSANFHAINQSNKKINRMFLLELLLLTGVITYIFLFAIRRIFYVVLEIVTASAVKSCNREGESFPKPNRRQTFLR